MGENLQISQFIYRHVHWFNCGGGKLSVPYLGPLSHNSNCSAQSHGEKFTYLTAVHSYDALTNKRTLTLRFCLSVIITMALFKVVYGVTRVDPACGLVNHAQLGPSRFNYFSIKHGWFLWRVRIS